MIILTGRLGYGSCAAADSAAASSKAAMKRSIVFLLQKKRAWHHNSGRENHAGLDSDRNRAARRTLVRAARCGHRRGAALSWQHDELLSGSTALSAAGA